MLTFLIGFMGSGKSTVGKKTAEMLGFDFIDLDHAIEKKEGKTVTQIFEQEGEAQFRSYEKDALRQLATIQNAVVATGGGCPAYHNNMTWMNETGRTVYLKVNTGTLFLRLCMEKKDRPLIASLTDIELMEFINEKLSTREKIYIKAQQTIETMNENPATISERLVKLLK